MRVSILSISYLLQERISEEDKFADALTSKKISLERSWRQNLLAIQEVVVSIEEPARVAAQLNHEIDEAFNALSECMPGNEKTDFYYERLNALYKYFYTLDLFFQELMKEDKFINFITSEFRDVFSTDDYDDPNGFLDDFDDYARSIVQGILARMQAFTNIILAKICNQFRAGHINYNHNPETMEIEEKGNIGEAISFCAKLQMENLLQKNGVRLRAGRQRLSSIVSVADLSDRVFSPSPVPQQSVLSGIPQKWRALSCGQKCLFGGLIALEVIAIVAAAVFAPASALLTIKGAMVLNAKVLALLMGAAVLAGTAVCVDRARRDKLPVASDLFAMESCHGGGSVCDLPAPQW